MSSFLRRVLGVTLASVLVFLLIVSLPRLSLATNGQNRSGLQQQPTVIDAMGMEIVGHTDLDQERGNTSDVWYLNGVAYTGYRCGEDKGSSIVDVSDPANPQVMFQTEPMSRTFANDVKAIAIDTNAFTGDLLLEPHDECAGGVPAATRIWDVTEPSSPTLLTTFVTGDGVHNAYPYQRGSNAYVILAASGADNRDNSEEGWEDRDLDADFAIVDITDPRDPAIVGRWNIHDEIADLPGSTFQHDVWANPDGTVAYGAYWDAGMVLLDISDVTSPTLISRLTYPPGAAGNTHAAVPTEDESHVVITDEDFSPYESSFAVLEPEELAGTKNSNPGSYLLPILEVGVVAGPTEWVGRGCPADDENPADPYLADATDKVAMILRGGCTFRSKIARAEEEGAIGAVIINNRPSGTPPMGGSSSGLSIPGVGISYDDGNAITTTQTSGVTVTVQMEILPGEWGFTRVADVTDLSSPSLVAEYTITETRAFPSPPGNFSVHNPWVVGDDLFLSHYSAGTRLIDISDPSDPREKGYIVPGIQTSPTETIRASIWGVITDENGLVYASDINNGLWILRVTDPPRDLWNAYLPALLMQGALGEVSGPAHGSAAASRLMPLQRFRESNQRPGQGLRGSGERFDRVGSTDGQAVWPHLTPRMRELLEQ